MKWSAIVAGVFAVAFLSGASAEGMAKATQSPKKEIQLASIVVPTWKDLGTKASTKKIRLVRVFKYWSALKARDKKAIKALYSNASDRSAAAMKVDKFYNGANQCLRKQKEFKRKTRAQVNQALSKVAQCIKRTVKPPTFTVPVTQALPADYYNPIMPDPSEYDKEDAEDATEDPTGTQPLPAVAPGADDEENTFETAAVDEPGEEAPTSTDPTEGIDFEDSYEEPAIQAPHDYSVGGPGSIYREEQPVVEPPTGTYPQPVEEEGPTTTYQNEQPGEFVDNGIVHENQNMQPEEPPFNPELVYHNEQAPVPHDYSVGGPGSIYREEQPVVEPPTGSYPQPVEEEGPTTTYQGEERPEEVMPAGVDQLVAMNPNRWPFSPTSRDVPPLWALDLDSSNAVSLDEWAAYVKRLHGLAVEIASVGRDAHAVNLLMKIIDSHYRALDYCIHQKLGATGEKELKSPEFTDVAEWIQANCYVKFRYSLFAGVPPFEWIAEDQPTVSVDQVEKWFSEEVATARRDLTRIQAVPVTPEHQVVVEKFIACTDAVLKQAHNAPVDRDMYYGALRQIEECAHH